MPENVLARLFEHNHWANLEIVRVCSDLNAGQLDAEPGAATRGSIRITLRHLIESQQNLYCQLVGQAPRFSWDAPPSFDDLLEALTYSGEGLLDLARV